MRLVALTALGSLAACAGDSFEPEVVSSVTIEAPGGGTPSLSAFGETIQLTAKAFNEGGGEIPGQEATWVSTNTAVARVNPASGVTTTVTAVGNGTATIRATVSGVSKTIAIEVQQVVTQVEVTPATPTLTSLGATAQLGAEAQDSHGNAVAGKTATWTSSNNGVVGVSGTGLVTAVANGTATITATVEGIGGTTTVTVAQVASTITLAPPAVTLTAVGQNQQFTALAFDALGTQLVTPPAFTWTSSQSGVATIHATTGMATATGNGTTTITASTPTLTGAETGAPAATMASGTATLTVTQALDHIVVTPANPTLAAIGATQAFTAQGFDAQNQPLVPQPTYSWSSSATGVATIDATSGLALSVANGTTTITASAPGAGGTVNGTTTLTVQQQANAAHSTATVPTGTAGSATTITITVRDATDHPMAGQAANLALSVTGANTATPAQPTDNGNGTYTTSYTPQVAGTDNVAISLSGAAIGGSPYASTVQGGPAASLQVAGITDPFTAGTTSSVTVTARDAFGNIATGYAGTVVFTSTDAGAGRVLPANYTFLPADAGTHTFAAGVKLVTVGEQTVTATDNVTGTITGSQPNITVQAGGAATLQVTGIGDPITAGATSSVTVTARDAVGNVATGYTGTIVFSSTDGGAGRVLPANYTFVPGDAGTHTFTNAVTLVTAGEQTVTATDNVTATITGSQPAITVQPGGAATLQVTGISDPFGAGGSSDVTVTARDAHNNVATGYTGTIVFTSTDGGVGVVLPANYTFLPADLGTHTFAAGVKLVTVGEQTVTATDNVTGSITGTQSGITVVAGGAVTLQVTGISDPITAGAPSSVTVTARDAQGNVAQSYAGTVTFTSSDAGAGVVLPTNYTFLPGDAGTHTFTNAVTLVTAGEQTVTARDVANSSINGTQAAITVQPGAAIGLDVTGITDPFTAGATSNVVVTARDSHNNVATGYTGTVVFSSTDVGAGVVLPANYTFGLGDAGTHTFAAGVKLVTVGEQTVTATDNVTAAITGSQTAITVQAGGATTLQVTGIGDPFAAGATSSVTVTARDGVGNVATGYTGTVVFSSTDGGAGVVLPANYTFLPGDAGTHTFTNAVTLVTAGEQTVTATDNVTGTITGSQTAITVQPGGAAILQVTGITDPFLTGSTSDVTVTARDAHNNVATGYTGTVVFSSTDVGVGVALPANYTFLPADLGTHTFAAGVKLVTVGEQTVTATDNVTGTITGSQSAITVVPGGAATLEVSGISDPFAAGATSTVVVTARDAQGNVATGYTGTIVFSSTDGGAGRVLPPNYTFLPGDAGTHTFTNAVTLVTAGEQTVTATDNVTATITGSQPAITVQPGGAATLQVTGITDPFTAGATSNVVVTARDSHNNVATGYTGTVVFSSTDVGAGVVLPANYTFLPGDAGTHTFTSAVTLVTAGEQTVTATDNVTATITGSQAAITVQPGGAAILQVTGITDPFTAGATSNVVVTARDSHNNVATGYTGTVVFSSTDVGAGVVLPANYTFLPADAGTHTFAAGVKLVTVGEQTVTATDNVTGTITGSQTGITVQAGGAATLQVTGISDPFAAGATSSVTVTARDAVGNVATGYTGTIVFSSTDGGAGRVLPANYTFLPGDAGTHTFTNAVTLVTAGEQTVTATDNVTATITGSQPAITVQPGGAATLQVTGITDPFTAGATSNVVVTARDIHNNVATGYLGTIAFTSTDVGVGVVLPANYTFLPADLGTHTFAAGVKLVTVGEQTVTATDNVTATITGNQAAITVQPGAAVTLQVTGIADPIQSGVASNVTVTARDAQGNVATGYTGTIVFSSTDVGVGRVLPANYTFVPADAGIHTFTNGVTLVTLGEQTVTATDNVTATITGSQTAITVQGGAVLLEVTGILDPLAPGQPTNVVVTAKDALGGVATTYTGTVHFTTTDPSLTVVLPPDYTFLPADAGVHTFTNGVTLRTIGEQTVTATDIVTATITGAQAAITVQPGPLHHVVLTPVLMTLTSLAQQQQYTAVGQDVFNNPVSPPAVFTWTATPGGVANVSGTGLATPVAAGTTTIRATSGGIFAEATLHVVVGLASITITPSNPTVTNLGTPTQFTAVARDAGNAPLSPQPPFVWTSSDTTVAIVDAGGQAGAGGNGVTTITASVVGIAAPVGNTNLTVNDGTAREVIVANYDDDDLSIVDGRTNTVTQTIGSGGGAPFGIALAPGGGTSYISNLASDNIGVLNNATKTLGTPITLAASSGPVGITTTPDGAYIATTTPGTNSLTLIRTSDNMITTVPIGAEPYEVVAISNNLIWVTNSTPQGYITQYNIATTDTIKKEAGFYTGGIAAHNGVLVVAAGGSNAVLFHDATTGVQLGVLNAGDGIGAQPDGVAITSGGIAYVANLGSNTVSVINVASRSLITNIPVGNRPRGVTVSPDGRLVYVVNEGGDPGVVDDAYVSVISTAMNEVVARVTVGLQAKRAVAR